MQKTCVALQEKWFWAPAPPLLVAVLAVVAARVPAAAGPAAGLAAGGAACGPACPGLWCDGGPGGLGGSCSPRPWCRLAVDRCGGGRCGDG